MFAALVHWQADRPDCWVQLRLGSNGWSLEHRTRRVARVFGVVICSAWASRSAANLSNELTKARSAHPSEQQALAPPP